jgi:O-antigen/teichoic acid export membrane protein
VSTLLDRTKTFLPKGGFASNVTLIVIGTALGQALVVLASPVLTRFFTPDDFGVLAVFMAVISISLIFSSLGYELAIPLPESDREAVNLLAISIAIVPIVSLLGWLGIVFFGHQIVELFNAPLLAGYLWLLPIGFFVVGFHQALVYWATRKSQFGVLSYSRVLQSTAQVGTQVPVGAGGAGPGGLVAGVLAGRILASASLLRRAEIPFHDIQPSTWLRTAWQHRHFPIYTTWASLLTTAGTAATPIMFAFFFPLHVVGIISLNVRILGLPAAIIGQAVAQVFYPRAAQLRGDVQAAGVFVVRVASALLLVAIPVFMFIGLAGPTVFPYVFGANWNEAGLYARYLAPWLALNFIASPLSTFSLVKSRQRAAFFITTYELVLRFGGIWLGGRVHSPLLATALYSGAGFVISGVYIAWILHLTGTSLRAWLQNLTTYLVVGSCCLFLLVALGTAMSGIAYLLVTAVVVLGFGAWGFVRHREVFPIHG